MTSKLQLLTFFVSFVYGVIFYFLTILNFKLLSCEKKWLQHLITVIYVLDIIIIYTIIIYKLNHGYFHIYFIIMVLIGFGIGAFLKSKINVNSIFKHFKKR